MLLTAKSPRNDSKIDILLFCSAANLQLSLLFSSQTPSSQATSRCYHVNDDEDDVHDDDDGKGQEGMF